RYRRFPRVRERLDDRAPQHPVGFAQELDEPVDPRRSLVAELLDLIQALTFGLGHRVRGFGFHASSRRCSRFGFGSWSVAATCSARSKLALRMRAIRWARKPVSSAMFAAPRACAAMTVA